MNADILKRMVRAIAAGSQADLDRLARKIVEDERRGGHPKLADQLETAFSNNGSLSAEDKVRLASLEEVVEKIRKELGGEDDGPDGALQMMDADEPRPSTAEEAFRFLHSTTIKLVDELKKTTRFSISAIAIQSSNNVLKLVKFLRLRK